MVGDLELMTLLLTRGALDPSQVDRSLDTFEDIMINEKIKPIAKIEQSTIFLISEH